MKKPDSENTSVETGFAGGESWTVSYDGEVYWDACKMDGEWYYRGSFKGGLRHFELPEKVTPICKNLTRTKAGASPRGK